MDQKMYFESNSTSSKEIFYDYVEKAIENGATKIVIEKNIDLNSNVEKIIVNDTNEWLTNHIVTNYSKTINKMNIIGITGTKAFSANAP